jgi:hypothetical protein
MSPHDRFGDRADEYARTRHNVGAETVELLATRHRTTLKKENKELRAQNEALSWITLGHRQEAARAVKVVEAKIRALLRK